MNGAGSSVVTDDRLEALKLLPQRSSTTKQWAPPLPWTGTSLALDDTRLLWIGHNNHRDIRALEYLAANAPALAKLLVAARFTHVTWEAPPGKNNWYDPLQRMPANKLWRQIADAVSAEGFPILRIDPPTLPDLHRVNMANAQGWILGKDPTAKVAHFGGLYEGLRDANGDFLPEGGNVVRRHIEAGVLAPTELTVLSFGTAGRTHSGNKTSSSPVHSVDYRLRVSPDGERATLADVRPSFSPVHALA